MKLKKTGHGGEPHESHRPPLIAEVKAYMATEKIKAAAKRTLAKQV